MRTILRGAVVSLASLIILSLMPRTARAATIHVPADQPTIQAAINAASNGDTVLIAPGTYRENINFMGKAITVTSSGGPAVTTVDGGAAGTVVTFNTNEGRNSVLSGFTITNGSANGTETDGGGIYISHASPTVSGNVVTQNVACSFGAGVAAESSSALIQGNTITNNGSGGCSGGNGGGISVLGAGSVQIIGNTIAGNFLNSGSGAGISLYAAGTPTIENNTISGNTATGLSPQGGGIWIVDHSDALIVQNLIVNNTAGQGGGVYFLVPSGYRGPFLINNTIANNAGAGGSGIYAVGFDSQSELINNLIIASPGQPALYCDASYGQTPQTFQNNDAFSSGATALTERAREWQVRTATFPPTRFSLIHPRISTSRRARRRLTPGLTPRRVSPQPTSTAIPALTAARASWTSALTSSSRPLIASHLPALPSAASRLARAVRSKP
jgi:parallel beta-helix repeat protein